MCISYGQEMQDDYIKCILQIDIFFMLLCYNVEMDFIFICTFSAIMQVMKYLFLYDLIL